MTPEELALLESGNVLPEIEETEELELTELDLLSEQLGLHSIESEERHEQILEAVEVNHQCLQRLEVSSTTSENPLSQSIATDLSLLKTELAELRGMLTAIQASITAMSTSTRQPPQSESSHETPPLESENPEEQSRERLTEEPRQEEPAITRKKHKVL